MSEPTPEALSRYMAIHLFNAGEFDEENEVIFFDENMCFHDGEKLIHHDDWQPHLDENLGQTYQCLEKLRKKFSSLIFMKEDNYLVTLTPRPSKNYLEFPNTIAEASDKSLALAILTAIWRAMEGEK